MSRVATIAACRGPVAALLLVVFVSQVGTLAVAQAPVYSEDQPADRSSSAGDEAPPAVARVDVEPVARDDQIRDRVERILVATGWFTEPSVHVEEGFVFLRGGADSDDLKK